jgi:hypothetical protein
MPFVSPAQRPPNDLFTSPAFAGMRPLGEPFFTTPPRVGSQTSLASTQTLTPGAAAKNLPGYWYNLISNPKVIKTGLFITNAVAIGSAISPVALATTNFVFLVGAAIAFPTMINDDIKGTKKVVVLVAGYVAIAGLVALNILLLIGFFQVPTVGWILCGATFGSALIPMMVESSPKFLRKKFPCCFEEEVEPLSDPAMTPTESIDPIRRSAPLLSHETDLKQSPPQL